MLKLDTAKMEAEQAGVITGGGKVETSQDSLATDMMTFLAKDAELAGMIGKFPDHKLEYHQSLTDQVRSSQSIASVFPPNSFYEC